MKKLIWISLALSILLCACDRTDPPVTTEPIGTTGSDEAVVTTAEPPETLPVGSQLSTKTVSPALGNSVLASYEVLVTGDTDLDALLEAEAAKILARYIPNASSIADLGGTAEYSVKATSIYESEEIVSAVFSGSYAIYYENSEAGGDVLYTVNIDPAANRILETPDVVEYAKIVEALQNGRFDVNPDFSHYDPAYGIYPYVSMETVEGNTRLGVYITKGGMYEEVLGYYISLQDATDFLK